MVMDQMLRVQDRRTSAEQRHGELVKLSRDRRWLADDVTFVGAGETPAFSRNNESPSGRTLRAGPGR